jgi:hypothetical protein
MAGHPRGLILSSNTGRPAPGPVVQILVYAVWVYVAFHGRGLCNCNFAIRSFSFHFRTDFVLLGSPGGLLRSTGGLLGFSWGLLGVSWGFLMSSGGLLGVRP